VWGDRYHRRDLGSPREVRNALVYVNNNHLKHHEWDAPDRAWPEAATLRLAASVNARNTHGPDLMRVPRWRLAETGNAGLKAA